MQTKNIEKYILMKVREYASDQTITGDSSIKWDVGIDSIGWLRCLIDLEKEYNCIFNPQVIFSDGLKKVQDFIDIVSECIINHNLTE